MDSIKKKWLNDYGYNPEDNEILSYYQCGALILTDKEEDELLKYFNL